MNSIIYEINTRVWINRFRKKNKSLPLHEIPHQYWLDLRSKGIEFVWLMGIWKTVPSSVEKYCFVDGLVKEYDAALPDWEKEDVIGSPYAIDKYEINPQLGTRENLMQLKNNLNQIGLKLILDFVPNHFSAETSLLSGHSELFLDADEALLKNDPVTFFRSSNNDKIYAHGKDPYFDAWQDTVQVNYSKPETQNYMVDVLLELTELCDGVRCDMAMLILNSVFSQTWKDVLDRSALAKPIDDFWDNAIKKVKSSRNDFIFIAESYWDMEFELQKLGFDFTYDKRLYDRLIKRKAQKISDHLLADIEFQNKSVRFLENHDEPRASKTFRKRVKAASIIISTIPGLTFFNDGQFEGKKIKLPVQLGREPDEKLNSDLKEFFDHLLSILKKYKITDGKFKILEPLQAFDDNPSNKNILAWLWENDQNKFLVVVNYSSATSVCRIKTEFPKINDEVVLEDILNGTEYSRPAEELEDKGLYIQLEPYESHIFYFQSRAFK